MEQEFKMKLGTEVGMYPGHIVLDGVPTQPLPKGEQLPIFGPCLLWPNGWMEWTKMPLGRDINFGPGDTVLDGD